MLFPHYFTTKELFRAAGKVLSELNIFGFRSYNFGIHNRFYTVYPKEMLRQGLHHRTSSSVKAIGTHDGRFHCDEVLACFMLRLLPEYANAQIIRTRSEDVLRTCDIIVDVGSEFNAALLRFDHHQKSFNETMHSLRPEKPWTTRLSSAGLVYVHYGEAVIAQILEKKIDDEVVQQVYDKMYENFIEEIDAVDNGISLNDYPMRYRVSTTLSYRVSYLNPTWRDVNPSEWECFQKALDLVGKEFLDRVHYYASDWWEAFSLIRAAVESRFDVDPSGEIVEFPGGGCPWKDHLAKLEQDFEIENPIQFVIFSDGNGMWRVQAVPITPDSFILRTPLLEKWRGLRGKDLADVSGIPNITFVHANGFIGGAAEREDAIRMAKISLRKC